MKINLYQKNWIIRKTLLGAPATLGMDYIHQHQHHPDCNDDDDDSDVVDETYMEGASHPRSGG